MKLYQKMKRGEPKVLADSDLYTSATYGGKADNFRIHAASGDRVTHVLELNRQEAERVYSHIGKYLDKTRREALMA